MGRNFIGQARSVNLEGFSKGNLSRDNIWTTELAVGSKSYVEQLRLKMGYTSKVTQYHPAVQEEQLPYGDRMDSNMMEWEIFDPREFAS